MRIAICDDCKNDAEALREMIFSDSFFRECELSLYENPSELISALEKVEYFDAYFLDIDMPDLDGLSLAARINQSGNQSIIVFFTAFPEYAVEAFECEAFHYLLKPLDERKVSRVLSRIARVYREKNRFIVVKNRLEVQRINVSDIYFVESFKKHLIFHMKDRKIEIGGKLSEIYEQLRPYGFYQVHQGYIVNMEKISRFDKYEIILDDEKSVMMSVRKRTEVLMAYTEYVERSI